MRCAVLLWLVGMLGAASASAQVTNGWLLNSFETSAEVAQTSRNNCSVTLVTNGVTDGQKAALVVFANVDWPNLYFKLGTAFTNTDWRPWGGVAIDILNTNSQGVTVDIRVDDDFSADGVNHCRTGSAQVPAGRAVTVVMPFTNSVPSGMRGGPPLVFGALNMSQYGSTIDLSHIVAFQLFLPKPGRQVALLVDAVRLVPPAALTNLADAYGQFTGGAWPGKIARDSDLLVQNTNELAWLGTHPKPADRDPYGAWKDGPQLPATGFFRTAYVRSGVEIAPAQDTARQGRWWLVAPSGRLFFSLGVDVINYGETTAVTGRENLFTWLPTTGDPLLQFAPLGSSRTANFYGMNLYRKYGTNWNNLARARAFDRLDSWGFNTIGNWSASDLFRSNRVAYTTTISYSRTGVAQFWSAAHQLPDVFDTNFVTRVAAAVSSAVSSRKTDPWCLGYFIDNELMWAGWGTSLSDQYALPMGVLADTNSLPSKGEFARLLQTRYASVAALNAAWGTAIASWDVISNSAVSLPATPNSACQADMSGFFTNFARRYFSVINTSLKQYAPNQLYLGCRFATKPMPAVYAAAEYCDVISFNIYSRSMGSNTWSFTSTLNKPCLIGEFHMGALDRGMFHPGLVQAADQADRGVAFQEYIRSVLSLPAFVGCHWFQYDDEPLTGRFDGENYNIGMVSGADTPYWELVNAVRQVNAGVYTPFAAPRLVAVGQTNTFTLSWPFLPSDYVLESATSVQATNAWALVTNTPAYEGVNKQVRLPVSGGPAYYRLRKVMTPGG